MHRRPNILEIVDKDETKLYEVRKHNFGIIIIYVQVVLGMSVAVVLSYVLLPNLLGDLDQAILYANLFTALVLLITIVVIVFTTTIYRQNRLIVTDRNITQVLQYGLFSRKVSQLNIVNVEDVTSEQKGFIPTIFNFGTLKIETAGEQSNFNFNYCPNSNYCAKVILDAREKMLGQTMDNTSPVMSRQARNRVAKRNYKQRTPRNNIPDVKTVKNIGEEIVEQAQK